MGVSMTIFTRDRLLLDEDASVNQGFAEYNSSHGLASLRHPVALVSYSDNGQLAGALDGYVFFDYLTVSRLWVASEARGHGLGTRLMTAAEDFASGLSCTGVTLSTYDFQARPFYEKLGYEVFGVLVDNPRGRERFFMRKTL
jgi:GNAT superfamily N-acetyltransferase